MTKPTWVSVDDRLPAKYTEVLTGSWESGGSWGCCVAVFCGPHKGWLSIDRSYDIGTPPVSHWMPLPGPPEGKHDLDKLTWAFKKPVIAEERLGCLVSVGGSYVSTRPPTLNVLRKACIALDAFHTFCGQHEIEIEEDSEQGVVVIDLMNEYVVALSVEKNEVSLIDRQGLVGYLERETCTK